MGHLPNSKLSQPVCISFGTCTGIFIGPALADTDGEKLVILLGAVNVILIIRFSPSCIVHGIDEHWLTSTFTGTGVALSI